MQAENLDTRESAEIADGVPQRMINSLTVGSPSVEKYHRRHPAQVPKPSPHPGRSESHAASSGGPVRSISKLLLDF